MLLVTSSTLKLSGKIKDFKNMLNFGIGYDQILRHAIINRDYRVCQIQSKIYAD